MSGDTIFAVATAVGRSGVAVIRISGVDAKKTLAVFGIQKIPSPRYAEFVKLSYNGSIIDEALVLYFVAPFSFTGEDVVELHVHGGRAIISAVIRVLSGIDGFRHAGPGEFTMRALLNNKMDMIHAEGIADIINADTDMQLSAALRQMSGKNLAVYTDWRQRLLKAASLIEYYIDFPEEDRSENLLSEFNGILQDLLGEVQSALSGFPYQEKIRSGFRVAIVGAPNAGKSTLVNAIAGRQVAIVSEIAGTTRDKIETLVDVGGVPVLFVDTAGVRRDSKDDIENEGIRRSLDEVRQADVKIVMFDSNLLPSLDQYTLQMIDERSILVLSKDDKNSSLCSHVDGMDFVNVSSLHKDSIDNLMSIVANRIKNDCQGLACSPVVTRERHSRHLEQVCNYLQRIVSNMQDDGEELIAEMLRRCVFEIDRVTGLKTSPDDVLAEIFSKFCVGK